MISMAIKYIVKPEEKRVIAVLENTREDALNKAMKICRELTDKCPNIFIAPQTSKLIMNDSFHGVAVCKEGDEFDVEEGKNIAKRICLEKYYASFDKKMNKFQSDLEVIGIRIMHITNDREI